MTADVVDIISEGIECESVVQFRYPTQDGVATALRTVSPWQITNDDTNLLGWDHDRDGIRKFHISRISFAAFNDDEHYARPAS